MTIKSFDRTTCQRLGAELPLALVQFAKERGIKIEYAGGQFGDGSVTVKLKLSAADPAVASDHERKRFAQTCYYVGLLPEDYGVEIVSGPRRFRIVGVSPNRPKYPIDAIEVSTGMRFKLPRDRVPLIQATRLARPKPTVPVTPDVGLGAPAIF